MRYLIVLLLSLVFVSCDVTVSVQVPCSAVFIRDSVLHGDTVAIFKADSTACPRKK